MASIPQDPQERAAYFEKIKTRFTTSRIIAFLGALVFIIFAALTAYDLYRMIFLEAFHWRTYFSWANFHKLIPFWPVLLGSGFVFYVAQSVREHYEMILIESGVRH